MRLIRLLKNDLAKETTSWVAENIISTEQAELICSRYGVDYHNQSKRLNGYFILVTLGYLFLGLALITLLSANWEEIPRGVRMSGLIMLTLSVNIFGIYKVSNDKNTAAVGYFFLGGLFYGASIMLIAQIYHIGEHYPDGIFWWAIGVLPVAVLMESSLLMILSATLGFIWFFVESSLHFYPALFPVFLAALAWHSFRIKQSNILFLSFIIGAGLWAEYCFSWILGDFQQYEIGPENFLIGIGIFILFYGLSEWFIKNENTMFVDYGTLLGLWTLRFAILSLFVFSFKEPWQELIRAEWEIPGLTVTLAFLLSAFSIWLVRSSQKQIILIAALSVLYVIILLILMRAENRNISVVFQISDNIILILFGIYLIVRGIRNAISHYFFLGVLIILATGLFRYIDLIGDYIGATILFIVFAAILLSAAKFWKSKHSVSRPVS